MRESREIVFASTNYDKLQEFKALLQAWPDIVLVPANKIIDNADKLKFVEQFDTYAENSRAKARTANQACHFPCLADDSGLEVESLDGKPGVHSRRFAIPKAGQTQDQANNEKLLEELKGHPMAQRKARFVCSLSLVMEGVMITGEGAVEGMIAEAPQGHNGFGYDPLFIPKDSNKTFAEMGDDEKNRISHRSRALNNLMAVVNAKGISFSKP